MVYHQQHRVWDYIISKYIIQELINSTNIYFKPRQTGQFFWQKWFFLDFVNRFSLPERLRRFWSSRLEADRQTVASSSCECTTRSGLKWKRIRVSKFGFTTNIQNNGIIIINCGVIQSEKVLKESTLVLLTNI